MREATPEDIEFCAGAMIEISRHLAAVDPYTANVPKRLRDQERDYVRGFIGRKDRLVLIEEDSSSRIALLMAEITVSNFSVAVPEPVGYIAIAWVAEAARRQGIMRRMLDAADRWFARHGVQLVEISYLSGNRLAESAWRGLGFQPFRVQAFRRIER